MTLGQVFSKNSLGINANVVADKYPGSKAKHQYSLLEQYLNWVYYGQTEDSKGDIINFDLLEQNLIKKFTSQLQSSMNQLANVAINGGKITGINTISKDRMPKKVEVGTYLNVYNRLTSILNSLNNAMELSTIEAEIKRLIECVQIANKQILTVIDELNRQGISMGNKFYSLRTALTANSAFFRNNENGIDFNYFMDIYNVMQHIDNLVNLTGLEAELARFFENAIQATNFGEVFDKFKAMSIDELTNELTKKSLGDTRGFMAGSSSDIRLTSTINIPQKYSKNSNLQELYGEYNIKNKDISLDFKYGTTGGKQLKADAEVSLFINDNVKNKLSSFKISAKNWATNIGSFNGVNLLSALSRSAGAQNTALYTLAMLNPSKSDFGEAIRLAKLSIVYDIVTGLSQQSKFGASEGYINTIVIKDNSARRIRVIDPLDIVGSAVNNQIYGNIKASLQGFNAEEQKENAYSSIRYIDAQRIISPGRTNAYLNQAYKYLKTKKVNVRIKF